MKTNEPLERYYSAPTTEILEIQVTSVLMMSNEDPYNQDPD